MAKKKLSVTKFGYFDVPSREYVITSPWTPAPWINYLGLEGMLCGMVSNTAGGVTWFQDPLERRVTRYIQIGCNKDRPGRWLYVRDNDTGRFWSPSYQPVTRARPAAYECRHGLGYTRIRSTYAGIASEMLFFIPLGEHVEVQRVVLRNKTDRERHLSLFSYREFVNDSGFQDLTNIQYSGHLAHVDLDAEDNRILYVMTRQDGWRPLPFFAVSEPVSGFETKCDVFIGDGSIENPQAVREGKTTDTLVGDDTAVGVLKSDLTLAPGQEKVVHYILGVAPKPTKDEAKAVITRWLGDDRKVLAALEELKAHAVGLVSALQVETPDEYASVMVNTWNAYQCWINFQFSRSISGYATGLGRSMGTRDSLQDLLGYMHMAPGRARQRILELMSAVQLQNGGCQHQYSALTKTGMGEGGFSDDHLWAVLAVCAYVKETSDLSILDEAFAYTDNRDLAEDLYHHLLRAIQYSYNDRGAHGIPRLRAADWNDTIGGGRNDEVSESVLVGIMLVKMAKEMVRLTEVGGRQALKVRHAGRRVPVTDYLEAVIRDLTRAVNSRAWVREGWYARGTDRKGRWFGVPSRAEGKIFLEPQPWSVMAGVASRDRAIKAMDNVYAKLFTKYGIQILQPGCTVAPSGNFTVFPRGAKENAGIFCHPNPWAVCAETMLGRGARALEYYRAILPPAASEPDPVQYCAEPYVYGQQRYGGEHREFGKCAGTWLTGTAAWNYVAVTQYILGLRPDWDGLVVDPCIPADWKGFRAVRRFRGATYDVKVSNPAGVEKGVKSVRVDGKPVPGNVLPAFGDGRVHRVTVVMG